METADFIAGYPHSFNNFLAVPARVSEARKCL